MPQRPLNIYLAGKVSAKIGGTPLWPIYGRLLTLMGKIWCVGMIRSLLTGPFFGRLFLIRIIM
jgi:hypothetical protein